MDKAERALRVVEILEGELRSSRKGLQLSGPLALQIAASIIRKLNEG